MRGVTTIVESNGSCSLPLRLSSIAELLPNKMLSLPAPLLNFFEEVQRQFEQKSKIKSLLTLSKHLQAELKQTLVSSPQCMLPSYNYTLPTGEEKGTYLALEVGGSNLRMALVELHGRSLGNEAMRIKRTMCFPINNSVRQLPILFFFDWMAEKIGTMLELDSAGDARLEDAKPLRMGIAWSFPIESVRTRPLDRRGRD